MTAPTKLTLYNRALTICGERHISALTEDRRPRHLLDNAWDQGAVDTCLEMGQWSFATRAVQVDYDASFDPGFGYNYAFSKPTDWKNTCAVCSDEYFNEPLTQYIDEADYWYADLTKIYVKYVSNDSSYGGDYSLWPGLFTEFVSAYLAHQIVMSLTADEKKQKAVRDYMKEMRKEAKNHSAQVGPTKFPPPGSFVQSRARNRTRNDRGNTGSLTG